MSLKSKYGMISGTSKEKYEANDPENRKSNKHTYLRSDITLYKPPEDKKDDTRVRFIANPVKEYIFDEIRVHFLSTPPFESFVCPKWAFYSEYELEGAAAHCPLCNKADDIYKKKRELSKEDFDTEKQFKDAGQKLSKEAGEYKATTLSLAYIVDRANPDKGVQIWAISGTKTPERFRLLHKDSENAGGIINFEDPDDGYDVFFNRVSNDNGTGFPGYTIIKLATKSTPLSESEKEAVAWWEYVKAHPTKEMLRVMSVKDIEKRMYGAPADTSSDEDDSDDDDEEETDDDTPVKEVEKESAPKTEKAAESPAKPQNERLAALKAKQEARKAAS
jgi:hypothetical protein